LKVLISKEGEEEGEEETEAGRPHHSRGDVEIILLVQEEK